MRGVIRRLRNLLFGVDDTVFVDGRIGYTGGFGRTSRYYMVGDEVPHTERGHSTYSVRMREGWWVSVVGGKIAGWSIKPIQSTVLDEHGKKWKGDPSEARGPKYVRE